VAVQGGQYAAKAILCKVKRQPELAPFQYSDKGSLAVIGRWAAVANASGVHLSGFLAWIVWACMHVVNLVTFRNRLLVFIQWAFEDLTFSRGARLITGTASTDLSFNKELAPRGSAPELSVGIIREVRADRPTPEVSVVNP